MRRLFARYLDGQIDESVWSRFMATLESFESNPLERSALIAFADDIFVGAGQSSSPQLHRLFAEAV